MKFSWSTLRVMDLEESIKFYEEMIGLPVVSRFSAGPGVEIAFLGNGETRIELICDGKGRKTDVGEDISWGFEVESLDEALSKLKEKGMEIIGEPIQPNPKTRFFFFKDPNGMRIQFIENLK